MVSGHLHFFGENRVHLRYFSSISLYNTVQSFFLYKLNFIVLSRKKYFPLGSPPVVLDIPYLADSLDIYQSNCFNCRKPIVISSVK